MSEYCCVTGCDVGEGSCFNSVRSGSGVLLRIS